MININLKNERYCFKCHKIKMAVEFVRHLFHFRQSGICKECKKKGRL